MYLKLISSVFCLALLVNVSVSKTSDENEEIEEENPVDPEVFVATREWQTIKEGKKYMDRCDA